MINVEVKYTLHVDEEDLPKLTKTATQMGMGYGDAGPKELLQRLAIDSGIEIFREVTETDIKITIGK